MIPSTTGNPPLLRGESPSTLFLLPLVTVTYRYNFVIWKNTKLIFCIHVSRDEVIFAIDSCYGDLVTIITKLWLITLPSDHL